MYMYCLFYDCKTNSVLINSGKFLLFLRRLFLFVFQYTVLFCKERSAENKGIDFPLRKANKRKSLNKTECARTLWRFIYLSWYIHAHIYSYTYTYINAHYELYYFSPPLNTVLKFGRITTYFTCLNL